MPRQDDSNQFNHWQAVAEREEFKDLMAAKARFIVPATVVFVVYYFALPILVGFAPRLMSRPVLGPVNIAYLFALSQFFVAWFIAWLYVRAAERFDAMGRQVRKHAAELMSKGTAGGR